MTTRIPEQGARSRFLAGLPPELRARLADLEIAGVSEPQAPASEPRRPTRQKTPAPTAAARRAAGKRELKLRARARHERRLERQGIADAKRLEKLRVAIIANGGADAKAIPLMSGHVFRQLWTCVNDATGRALELKLRHTPNKVAVGLILQATVGTKDAPTWRTWADRRTRCIATLALAFLMLAEPTKRRGKWQGFVRGLPRGAFCAALMNAYDHRPPAELPDDLPPAKTDAGERARKARRERRPAIPSTEAVFGAYGSERAKDTTYFGALVDVGFVYAQQLPRDAPGVLPFETCGPSGHTINRYWVVAPQADDTVSDETRAELLAAIFDADTMRAQWDDEGRLRRLHAVQAAAPPPPT